MKRAVAFLKKYDTLFVALIAAIISIVSTFYYFKHHDVLGYGDAVSRVDIARRILDFKQRGIQQIGGVWLPLPQLLMLPFIGFYKLWQNGLAGSFVSMIAYVVTAIFTFRLSKLISASRIAGILACGILLLNPNIIYMQATPMSELTLLATMLAGIYYFCRWFQAKILLDLVKSSIWLFLASLVRYEAWMVVLICAVVILFEAALNKRIRSSNVGQAYIFITVAVSGIILWALWSLVIFHNILYWATGENSAYSQQHVLAQHGMLPTDHNMLLSFTTILKTVHLNIGNTFSILSIVMIVIMLLGIVYKRIRINKLILVALIILLAPSVLDLLSLYSGNIVINTNFKELTSIRYGMPTIPFIAILISFGVSRIKRSLLEIIISIALVSSYMLLPYIAVLVQPEASLNIYTSTIQNAAQTFNREYKGGTVLAGSSAEKTINVVHAIGLPFKDYIQEGDRSLWQNALARPQKYVSYVVFSEVSNNNPTPDGVYTGSFVKHTNLYNRYYQQIYNKNGIEMYALKSLHVKTIIAKSGRSIAPGSGTAASSQPNLVYFVVNSDDSQTTIVRRAIHAFLHDKRLSPAEEAYTEEEMVLNMGIDSEVYPGQTIAVNTAQLNTLIQQSMKLSPKQSINWAKYGANINY